MDIPAYSWEEGVNYTVNDIVKALVLVSDTTGVTISSSSEQNIGSRFSIDPDLDYAARAMLAKGSATSETNDPNRTLIVQSSPPTVDTSTSIGVGIGLKFYDSGAAELTVTDPRNNHRLMAGSELDTTDYYDVQLYIRSGHIPTDAVEAQLVAFVYGWKAGSFVFKQLEAKNGSEFFYCIADNTASASNKPNASGASAYWTQEFVWRPTYNSQVTFNALNESLKLGEGHHYITNLAINSLPMQVSLSFPTRTDKEARAIIHFLQEKFFPYESIFSLDYKGDRLLSSEVASFKFKYTYPYKQDLRFTCTDFNHTKTYRNNNKIGATFVCNTGSILKSVESHSSFNPRIDALVPIAIDASTVFTKDEAITLNTFSLAADATTNLTSLVTQIEDSAGDGLITFSSAHGLAVGNCIYVTAPEASVFNVGLTTVTEVAGLTAKFSPVGSGSTATITTGFTVKKLDLCPANCLTSQPTLPPDVTSVAAGRTVYLKNYRKVRIDSAITATTTSVTLTPLETFTVAEKFNIIIPAVQGRNSIYLKDPDEFVKYPWLKVRNFDHKPSKTFDARQTPRHIQTAFLEYYKKVYKKGINQNLFNLSLSFENRSDEEAGEILQFLESCLGHSAFRFQLPRPYLKDDSYLTTGSRPYTSTFYCPSWTHKVVYKNNHTITASFMECASSPEEDLRDVFGLGRAEKTLCYGAELHDPITTYSVCPTSSTLQVKAGEGFTANTAAFAGTSANTTRPALITSAPKQVDLIFIIDGSNETTGPTFDGVPGHDMPVPKYEAMLDVIKKIVMAYDNNIIDESKTFPGTDSWGGNFVTPCPSVHTTDSSGNQDVPPWPIGREKIDARSVSSADCLTQTLALNSLLKGFGDLLDLNWEWNKTVARWLQENGYNIDNLDRFKIKIDQKRVNIGIVYMGANPEKDDVYYTQNLINLSGVPESFDKHTIYGQLARASGHSAEGSNYPLAFSLALSQFYNSPRARTVSDRAIILLSSGRTSNTAGDTGASEGFINQYTLDMAPELREGGALGVRRPTDAVLQEYGYKRYNPYIRYLKYSKSDTIPYRNPDHASPKSRTSESQNPDWYAESLPITLMFGSLGYRDNIPTQGNKEYAYDYDASAPSAMPQFYFPITDSPGGATEEMNRLVELIDATEVIVNDTGQQNFFSITLTNCGPKPLTLLNTIVSMEGAAPLGYTTEWLKSGIPHGSTLEKIKKGTIKDLSYIESGDSYDLEFGGQFYDDTGNKNLLQDTVAAGSSSSNIRWQSFNTQYEVRRNGTWENIDGGWAAHSAESQGVLNAGVGYKRMPVRVFKNSGAIDGPIEVIDYNIGNAGSPTYKGDYSHLPVLQSGEKIDLFFGIRTNSIQSGHRRIQLFINSTDGDAVPMACFGNIDIRVNIPSNAESWKDEAPYFPYCGPKIDCGTLKNGPDEDGRLKCFMTSNETVGSHGWIQGDYWGTTYDEPNAPPEGRIRVENWSRQWIRENIKAGEEYRSKDNCWNLQSPRPPWDNGFPASPVFEDPGEEIVRWAAKGSSIDRYWDNCQGTPWEGGENKRGSYFTGNDFGEIRDYPNGFDPPSLIRKRPPWGVDTRTYTSSFVVPPGWRITAWGSPNFGAGRWVTEAALSYNEIRALEQPCAGGNPTPVQQFICDSWGPPAWMPPGGDWVKYYGRTDTATGGVAFSQYPIPPQDLIVFEADGPCIIWNSGNLEMAELAYNGLLRSQANCEFWMGWKIYFASAQAHESFPNWRFQPRINNIRNWVKASHEIQDDPDIPGSNYLITDQRGRRMINQPQGSYGLTSKFQSFKFTPIPLP